MQNPFLIATQPSAQTTLKTRNLATVASVSTSPAGVTLKFPGEDMPRPTIYKCLASYTPRAVGDKVLVIPVGASYVVLGKIS